MGILDGVGEGSQPQEVVAAESLVQQARDLWSRMVSSFNEGAELFWRHPEGVSPQQIADALGSNAVEVFSLHGKLGNLIASVNQEAIASGLSVVGQFEYHEDGTVTVSQTVNE